MEYTELCPTPHIHMWNPSSKVTIFGDRTIKQVIKNKWTHKGKDLAQQDWLSFLKE